MTARWAAFPMMLLPLPALAQGVDRTNLRYDEDWSVLRSAPGNRQDRYPLNYIPLDEEGASYLTLGGEVRTRFEAFDDNLWGSPPAPDDSYLWLRIMPHADLHAGPLRVFVQGIAGHARGVGAGEGPADETGIDLLQGFADARIKLGSNATLMLRGGRELMAVGSERLVGIRYGPNIPQAFDGVRVIAEAGRLRVDAFHLWPVEVGHGPFDDATSRSRRLNGVYASVTDRGGTGIDLYWLGYENDAAHFQARTGSETRDTIGLRFFGSRGRLGWNWETMLQRGHFGREPIRAWSIATETSLSFPAMPFKPGFRLRANVASGDRDPGDKQLGTFNALFPKGKYFGELSPVGPRNIVNLHPSLELDFGRGFTAEIVAARFWRESRGDGIYDVPGQLVRAAGTSQARHVGDQLEISAGWSPSSPLSFSASLSLFRPGAFIKETGPAHVIRMAGGEAMFKF